MDAGTSHGNDGIAYAARAGRGVEPTEGIHSETGRIEEGKDETEQGNSCREFTLL